MPHLKEHKVSWAFKKDGEVSNAQLILLDNVQFIYELALAQLELKALDTEFELNSNLRDFKLVKAPAPELLRKRLAYFKAVNGEYTDYFHIIQKNRTRSVNQYLTHWIYPYKGKFHPQMIRALLNIIGLKRKEAVLDPFIGSGTTAVEAQLLGIDCIGIDISPLCVLQSRIKTEAIKVIPEIERCKENIFNEMRPSLFNPKSQDLAQTTNSIPEEKVKGFYKVAELIAHSDRVRRGREFFSSFIRNVELMLASVGDYKDISQRLNLRLGEVNIQIGDARQLPLEDESIDGIITSPPYSIALDYVSNDAHALKALGYNLEEIREQFIGVRGKGFAKVNLYNKDMMQSFSEMYRVLKPGKFCVIVIGNATVSGTELNTVQLTIDKCKELGFRLVKNVDKIIFGLYNVMRRENILIFQKSP
jgi:DNA modification methylase